MYQGLSDMVKLANEQSTSVLDIIIKNEIHVFRTTKEEIYRRTEKKYDVMYKSANEALTKPVETKDSMIYEVAKKQSEYEKKGRTICGSLINKTMAMALSSSEVNSTMGRVCAAPTAGSCGVLPAVLVALSNELNLDKKATLDGLIVAGGIGAVIMKNATVSGAEGGCQAECGAAAAMASGAAVHMMGGTPEEVENAVVFVFMNVMGLVCDSIAGQVQVPCAQRNASQAVNALLSADLSMAGMPNIIPADEVIEAMYKVGHQLPVELKETSMGGIAKTPTGIKIAEEFIKKHKIEEEV